MYDVERWLFANDFLPHVSSGALAVRNKLLRQIRCVEAAICAGMKRNLQYLPFFNVLSSIFGLQCQDP